MYNILLFNCKLLENKTVNTYIQLHSIFVHLPQHKQQQSMFDSDKAKELEKHSHVRGILSKEFFSGQQSELQKKRRQMKRILDQQVQDRKRAKEREKQEWDRKQRKQEEQIRKYYEDVIERQKRLSDNVANNSIKKNNLIEESNVKKNQQNTLKARASSKAALQDVAGGDIPLMPVMAMSEGNQSYSNVNNSSSYNSYNNQLQSHNYQKDNLGNIPLLDLSDQTNFQKSKKKSKVQVKREKTQRQNNSYNQTIGNSNVKQQQSRQVNNQNLSLNANNMVHGQSLASIQATKKNQRRRTLSDEDNNSIFQQNIINSRMSKVSKYQQNALIRSPSNTKRNTEMEIPEQIQQMQNENKLLKSQLKKSQQAISLLIGAVRSNAKLDKFRVQAERILHSSQNQSKIHSNHEIKLGEKREESPLLLPKLKIKHQSIMYDYLFEAARKAKTRNLKK